MLSYLFYEMNSIYDFRLLNITLNCKKNTSPKII